MASPSPLLLEQSTVNLVEIFSAIQGEGLNVGTRQIFIRFGGCDLRCHFCDSAHTWTAKPTCQIEQSPGLRDFVTHQNPVTLPQILQWLNAQDQPGLHDSISLTGGEPLLHAAFLAVLLPRIRHQTQLPLYLETGGHHPDALAQLLPYLDSVGMDLKLPSVSGESHWDQHGRSLEQCHQAAVDVFCKLIISAQTQWSDLVTAAQLVADINPTIPIFLQPVTPLSAHHPVQPPTPSQVLTWQSDLKQICPHIRVIPQTHKFMGQL
ncbi:7-carboxy-7-deazaguanine synthase QueE [Acaryochloris sp. IP29b_bin.148]|uniref:7-carboxy-7-deazaguanine synthase QueE n=1 Tax=Acaryochloris sp. IP29b_bin.148 TaxID=2969218 RepID=UPI00261E2328|nr:7-carboxy-7-deazaguanine synthase QueE [Acaryochloris sp. IP29b_bin.148]